MTARLALVAPAQPTPDPYVPAPDGARLRVDSLAANVRRLQGVFSAPFVTATMLTEARRLAGEIARDAALLPGALQ